MDSWKYRAKFKSYKPILLIYRKEVINMELWRKFEENYSVSSYGRIRNDLNGYILIVDKNNMGYRLI